MAEDDCAEQWLLQRFFGIPNCMHCIRSASDCACQGLSVRQGMQGRRMQACCLQLVLPERPLDAVRPRTAGMGLPPKYCWS